MDSVGIDLVQMKRIQLKDSFINMILTPFEKKEYEVKTSEKQRTSYLAGRFAAKEALFKATQDKRYLSYSILNDENGCPYVLDHPELSVSISHDGEYAVAVVTKKGV